MNTDSDTEQIAIAQAIATIAHLGQVDKAGNPYIDHPRRVAEMVAQRTDDKAAVAAAWLHDVLEDTTITIDDLKAAGVQMRVRETVRLLTRTADVAPEVYYAEIKGTLRAWVVKLADIDDNTDPSRLALLDDATIVRLTRKYAKARAALDIS